MAIDDDYKIKRGDLIAYHRKYPKVELHHNRSFEPWTDVWGPMIVITEYDYNSDASQFDADGTLIRASRGVHQYVSGIDTSGNVCSMHITKDIREYITLISPYQES
jgi:hypothetical protein